MTDTQTEPADLDDPSPLACTMAAECPADTHEAGCQSQPIIPLAAPLPVRTGAVGSVLGDLPVIPAQNETTAIAQLANTLAYANAVPDALSRKPNDVFLVLLTARDLGVSLTTAIREFHVIDGKVTLSPKVKMAMVRQSGIGKVYAHQPPREVFVNGTLATRLCPCGSDEGANDEHRATWHGERADQPGIINSSTFTMEDAAKVPAKERGANITLDKKSTWKAYPKRMLSWRAAGFLMDDVFSEVGTGLYAPDEIGAVTDEDGVPIEVTAVESLPGLKGGRQPDAPPAETLDEDTLVLLKARLERVKAKPEAAEDLRAWWQERDLPPLARLTPPQARTLSAKLGAVEQAHGLVAESPGGAPVDRPESVAEAETVPTAPETPAGAQSVPEAPFADFDCGPPDGDVAGWLIEYAKGLDGKAIRGWFKDAGVASPAGVLSDQRRAWALAVHDRLAVASVRVLSGFGLSAEACEAVER